MAKNMFALRETKVCPRCFRRKNIAEKFGYRYQKGYVHVQSHCTDCRVSIPSTLPSTRRLYAKNFDDTKVMQRSWLYMAKRLVGRGFRLSDRAREKWDEL